MNYANNMKLYLSSFESNLNDLIMKKVFSLFVLLLMIVFIVSSCSKEESTSAIPLPAPSITGTWVYSKTGSIGSDGTISNLSDYPHTCATKKDNWKLTVSGEMITQEFGDCQDDPYTENYTYNYQNKILSFSNENAFGSWTVISVSYTQLKIKSTSRDGKLGNNYFEFTRK